MFDSEQIHPSHHSVRRVEKKLDPSEEDKQEIIDNLVDTIDELRIFSEPTATERITENVPLECSTLPQRYNLLNMTQARLHDGSYKTKITIPGRTLTLEGTRIQETGAWRVSTGDREHQPLEHTDAIIYLRTILSNLPSLDSLADRANISDATMIEALWQDLAPLADEWKDATYYNTSVDHYNPSPVKDTPLGKAYMTSVAAVVGHIETSSSTKYTCRIGTELPIDLINFDEGADREKSYEVNEEYRFSVDYPKNINKVRTAMAFFAIESDHLTSGTLHDLASAATKFTDDIPSVYKKATDHVKARHLDMNNFLDD